MLNEYLTSFVPGGAQINLGDAYGDDERRVVFEMHVPEFAALGPAKVAEVVLRYVSVRDDATRTRSRPRRQRGESDEAAVG